MANLSMEALVTRLGQIPQAAYTVPRWRIAPCTDTSPNQLASSLLKRIGATGSKAYSDAIFIDNYHSVFVASHTTAIGIAGEHSASLPGELQPAWANAQDLLLARRGFEPGTILLLKQAAWRATRHATTPHLKQCYITPLPHTTGDVMISHNYGLRWRGRAWWHEDFLLAMSWLID